MGILSLDSFFRRSDWSSSLLQLLILLCCFLGQPSSGRQVFLPRIVIGEHLLRNCSQVKPPISFHAFSHSPLTLLSMERSIWNLVVIVRSYSWFSVQLFLLWNSWVLRIFSRLGSFPKLRLCILSGLLLDRYGLVGVSLRMFGKGVWLFWTLNS